MEKERMILTIVKSLGSLASSYVDGKVQTQKVKAEIQKKQLTGEIDWDLEAIKATPALMKAPALDPTKNPQLLAQAQNQQQPPQQ